MGYFVILFFFGLSAGVIGKLKGSSFWIWFMIGFFLPGVGTVAAILSRWENRELRRECENCGHVQQVYVQVCTNCGYDMGFPETPIVSEQVERELRAGGALAADE